MRSLFFAVLYTGVLLGANAALAEGLELQGDMRKFNLRDEPIAAAEVTFEDAGGAERSLAEWRGQWVLLNFWATWCAPCREEMPSLDRLQAEMGGEDFAVVPIATGRNAVPAVERFFAETGVKHLPILLDPKSQLAREMGVLALPVSVIIDPEGREVGRLMGDAAWDSDDAKALITALMAGG